MGGTRQDHRPFKSTQRGLPATFEKGDHWGHVPDPTWKNLLEILHRPWSSRIWIVQELLLSEYAEMRRGRKDIEVDILMWMAQQIDIHTDLRLIRQIHHPDEERFFAVGCNSFVLLPVHQACKPSERPAAITGEHAARCPFRSHATVPERVLGRTRKTRPVS